MKNLEIRKEIVKDIYNELLKDREIKRNLKNNNYCLVALFDLKGNYKIVKREIFQNRKQINKNFIKEYENKNKCEVDNIRILYELTNNFDDFWIYMKNKIN